MAVVTRLEIFNKDGSGLQSQPFNDNIPVSLNFNLADVREPDKRKASRSLTISIDASNEINKCFENIFEVNIATQYFNKNLKTPCKYFVNEILNFEGSLQLLKIVKRPDNSMVYECSIIGEGGSLFVEIGEKLIVGNANSSEDLDFSDYDHTYNRATQISTRANYGTGLDVVYPFIDKGSNGGSDTVWNTTDFLPCFHLREYIEKIITKAGYTFTSSILDSAEFKKYIVYPNLTSIPLSQSQLENRQFYVGLTANSVRTANSAWVNVNYTNETSGDGFFDDGSQSAGTYAIINDSGYYNIAAADYYRISFTHTDPSVVNAQALHQSGKRIRKSGNGGIGWFNLSYESYVNYDNNGSKININTYYYFTNQVATGEQFLTAGDYLEAQSYLRLFGITYYDVSNNVVATGTGTVTIELISGAAKTSFYALATRKELIAGNTLLAQNALPTKIKQKDLLMSIVKALNLYIDLDPDDKTNLIIESFDTFYNTLPILNYEGKTDEDKEKTVNVNILDSKRYIFKYKEDKDKFNEQYKNTWNEVFGSEQIDIENDFSKNDKVTEIIFSPTPNAANYGLGIAHPRIYKEEQDGGITVKKPIVPNIRLLVCGGVKQTANPYTYKDFGNADLITNDYLYAGHTDDPFNPTIDLNFGLPKEVYYTYVNTYFTTNNFYNRFHKYYIENLTNRDSKFETKYLWLNSKDINEFNFRHRIFSDGAYWIVNKIENYTPLNETSTKFELVKLLTANVFTPQSIRIIEIETVSSGRDVLTARMNTSLNVGKNVINLGENCIAVGENIYIPESCSNITAIGNNIKVEENVSNASVINTNDVSVTTNGYNAINGVTSQTNVLFVQTSNKSVTNTTTETSLIGTGLGSVTIPASSLNVGDVIRIKIKGVYAAIFTLPDVVGYFKTRFKINGTTLETNTCNGIIDTNPDLRDFEIEALITVRTVGSSGSFMSHGTINYTKLDAANTFYKLSESLCLTASISPINTTISNTLDFTMELQYSNANTGVIVTECLIEKIRI
jgi:hypothetical protein